MRDNMQTRQLTDAERQEISERYGVPCNVKAATVYKPGAMSDWELLRPKFNKKHKIKRKIID